MYLIDNKNYWGNIAKRDIYNLINYMMLIYVGYKYIKMRRLNDVKALASCFDYLDYNLSVFKS